MQPVSFTSTYKPSQSFLAWCDQHRPGVSAVIRDFNINELPISGYLDVYGRATRFRLDFPIQILGGLSKERAASFDRMVDTENPCAILDQHPDLLTKGPSLADAEPGDYYHVSASWLLFRKPDLHIAVKVTEKRGYYMQLELPSGEKVEVDIDEIRAFWTAG